MDLNIHLKNIIETSTDAILSINTKHIILSCNSASEKIFGYKKEELIGSEIYKIIPNRYKGLHKGGVDRFLQTLKPKVMGTPVELSALKSDGTEFPIELTLSYWEENGEYFFSGIIRDISSRKAIVSKMQSILDSTTDAVIGIDSNHKIFNWNMAGEKMFGYTKEEIVGEEIYIIIPEKFKERHKMGVERFIKTGVPQIMGKPVEVSARKKDGTEFPIELTLSHWKEGDTFFFSGIIRDITERKAILSRLQSILDSTNDAIIGINDNHKIFAWNPASEKMFGYSKDIMIGQEIMTIIPEKYKDRHTHGVERFLKTGVPHIIGKSVEVSALRMDGTEFPVELTLSHWKYGDKHFFSGIIRDITERKMQEAIVQKNTELLILEKKKVEEKQKEISDSIYYARKIQNTILPTYNDIQSVFQDSFVLYKPKDVVSGDFYWFERIEKLNYVYIAVADCTGHGVPGAMVSLVCSNVLSRVLLEDEVYETGKILERVRAYIIKWLGKGEGIKDGMDISLCRFELSDLLNKESIKMQWSGAYNPLIIVRENEIIKHQHDCQPVGHFITYKPFTTHNIELKKDDCLYLFTDGYGDQFGGIKGKKLKQSQLVKMFLELQNEKMDNQNKILENRLSEWQGDNEQVDDVCIIGIRV